jgi:hypothetical protein
VVIERPGNVLEHGQSLFEEMLVGTGRPVLIAAPDREPVQKIRSIALAWDGSANAARAIGFTLGLFPDLKQAEVLVVTGEKDLSDAVPGAEIVHHIDRHGAKARSPILPAEGLARATASQLREANSGRRLIVMRRGSLWSFAPRRIRARRRQAIEFHRKVRTRATFAPLI